VNDGQPGVQLNAQAPDESALHETTEAMDTSAAADSSMPEPGYGNDGFRRRSRREGGFSRRSGAGGRRSAPLLRRRPLEHKMTDLHPGQELRGTVCGVTSYGAFVDCGVYFEEESAEELSSSFEGSVNDFPSSDAGASASATTSRTENLDETSAAEGTAGHDVVDEASNVSEETDLSSESAAPRKRMIPFDGLVHIRDFSRDYIESPESIVSRGDEVTVYVKFVDFERRRLSLSLLPPGQQRPQSRTSSSSRNLYTPTETAEGRRILTYADAESRRRVGSFELDESVEGMVRRVTNFGAFIDIGAEVDAFVHVSDLWGRNKQRTLQSLKAGEKLNAQVCEVNDRAKRIRVRSAMPVGGEPNELSAEDL
jgi:predicted RNA-binding protein with RPS1 domain